MNKLLIFLCVAFPLFLYTPSNSQSPTISDQYWDEALQLVKQNKQREAAQLMEKSAEAESSSPNPRLDSLAKKLNAAGLVNYSIGRIDRAIKYFEDAMAINKKIGKGAEVNQLTNLAMIYSKSAQYDKALISNQEALSINKRLGKVSDVSRNLRELCLIYDAWGQYDKALKYCEESLETAKGRGDEASNVATLNATGIVYKHLGQYDKALNMLKDAQAINNKLGKEGSSWIELVNIGSVYKELGEYDKALKYYEDAESLLNKREKDGRYASLLNNIGTVYASKKKNDKARKYYEDALIINRKLGDVAETATGLSNIGVLCYIENKYDEAIKNLKEAVAIVEQIRKTATGNSRRDYLDKQILDYRFLISAYLRINDLENAFNTMEVSRARLLAERLSRVDAGLSPVSIRQIQEGLSDDTAIISYAQFLSKKFIIVIVITKNNIYGKEIEIGNFISATSNQHFKSIETLLNSRRGVVVRKKEKDLRVAKSADFDDIVNYYLSTLKDPGFRDNKESQITTASHNLNQSIYGILIKPIAEQVRKYKKLIIIPDGSLGYLPFETLVDENGAYLIETHNIHYNQSINVLESLKKRNYQNNREPIIAFGGAVYDEIRYAGDMINNEIQLTTASKDIYSSIRNRGSLRNAYASLDIAKWSNLPGTLDEVNNLSRIIPRAKIITGQDVSENNVKKLSASGELSKYRVVHFANHGIVVPEMPDLSAIVLSQFEKEVNGEDGYLRMGEIEDLNIKADFVNLSACDTGLGKIYGGEGVAGLAQSLLLAGANGISVSLWSVDDKSTSQFMISLYNLANQKKFNYAESIDETKRRFIKGDFGNTYKAPYYWAPFVYYGK